MTNGIVKLWVASSMIIFALTGPVLGGKKVIIGKAVAQSQQVSVGDIGHEDWTRLLHKFVDADGQVNYRAWKASDVDSQSLDAYLNLLSTANPSMQASQEAKLAFWINAYNAVTIKGILRQYPTSSIRNHTAKLLGYNIWHDLLLVVGQQKISLNDIEHKILRKFGEPRIHFAIVCASHSCPRLLNEAYRASDLETQLVENSTTFFANSGNFQHDIKKRQFRLSSILSWFGSDFGPDQQTQLKSIAPYLPTESAQRAARNNSVSVSYLKYDWSLNDQK